MCKISVFIFVDFISMLIMGYFLYNVTTQRSRTQNEIYYANHNPITSLSCQLLCEAYPYELDLEECCISSTQLKCQQKTYCLSTYLDTKFYELLAIRIELIFFSIVECVLLLLLIIGIYMYRIQHRDRNQNTTRQRAITARLMLYALRYQQELQMEDQRLQRSLLTQSFIAQNKDQTCAICLQMFGEQKVVRLNCRHVFHYECVGAWMDRETKCPVCRAEQ